MKSKQILVLTKFGVPTTTSLEGELWRNFTLSLRKSPGHYVSRWGRIEERSDCVLLITIWESQEQLDQFRASSPYQVYQSTLRQYSPLPPEVYEFDHIFPASKSQGKDQNIHKIKALEPKVAVMPRAQRATGRLSAHVSPSLPLWGHKVADDTSREGETKVFLTVYFWRDVEKEHHFKHVEKTRGKTQYELAEQELEDFGAESWTEVHWLKQNLPKFSN